MKPTQTPVQWEPTPLSPEVKQSGREADNSPASITEVKNGWKYTSIPPYAAMTCAQTNLRYFIIVTLHNYGLDVRTQMQLLTQKLLVSSRKSSFLTTL